jgi:hypothetical protein
MIRFQFVPVVAIDALEYNKLLLLSNLQLCMCLKCAIQNRKSELRHK